MASAFRVLLRTRRTRQITFSQYAALRLRVFFFFLFFIFVLLVCVGISYNYARPNEGT